MMKSLTRFAPIFLGVLVPTLLVGHQVWSRDVKVPQVRTKSDVLRAIPKHTGVLINIQRRLFPATWDITLLGQQATKSLRRGLLGNTQARVRWSCAQVLTQLRDASARPTLHQALKDWNASVRGQALLALAEIGDKSSVPFILPLLQSNTETDANRARALRALGRIGDARAVSAIIAQYDKAKKKPYLRRYAINAFWDLRRVIKRASLTAFLRRAMKDKDTAVVRRAVLSSGMLKDKSSLASLKGLLFGKSRMLRNIAAYVLGQIGDKRAIPMLVAALPRVRSGRFLNNISFALQRLKDPKLWDRLKAFLQHRQAFIRLNAAYTVGEMKLKQAVALLQKMLQDPNILVRNQAILALAKIGESKAVDALLPLLSQKKWEQKWLAMLAISRLSNNKKYRDLFFQVVTQSKNSRHRREAALILANQKDVRVAPFFFYLLKNRYYQSTWNAARKLKSPMLQDLLFQRLQSQLRNNRSYLLEQMLPMLSEAQRKAITKPLLRILFDVKFRPNIRRRRYRRWGRGNRQSMAGDRFHLAQNKKKTKRNLRLFKQTHRWGHGGFQNDLRVVIRALGQSGDQKLRPWLAYFLTHSSYHVRTETHVAMARLGDASSLSLLVGRLAYASDHHRPYLVKAIGRLPAKMLKERLLPLLQKRKDPYLHLAVGAALFHGGVKAGLAPLMKAVRSHQAALRKRASFYLRQMSSPALRAALKPLYQKERDPVLREKIKDLMKVKKPVIRVMRHFQARDVFLRK